MTSQTNHCLEVVAKILLRCWLFGFILLFIWLGVSLFMGETIYGLHSTLFGLTKHELQLIFYCGMGLLKILVLLFFFILWLAIKLVLRKSSITVNNQ